MIEIKNLHANVDGIEVLKGINLTVKAGETHAIMGPNGAGKSTLGKIIAGSSDYEVTEGEVLFEAQDILELEPEERAALGIFLGFQYPVEIPGVNNMEFLKVAVNSVQKAQGQPEYNAAEFLQFIKQKAAQVKLDTKFLSRAVNEGFSGGEKKRNEILQLLALDPKLAILDETDSGLDIDALKIVANGVNEFHNENNAVILVTHYQRLLDYIKPDFVHVLLDGKIVKSGGKELALELEAKGYADLG